METATHFRLRLATEQDIPALHALIPAQVEAAARAAGFKHFEMGSTLTGVPLYRLKGYVEIEQISVPLHNGEALPVVRMVQEPGESPTAS